MSLQQNLLIDLTCTFSSFPALGDDTTPSLIVDLPFNQYDMQTMIQIWEFMKVQASEYGFVVKFRFCTNSEQMNFPRSFFAVVILSFIVEGIMVYYLLLLFFPS